MSAARVIQIADALRDALEFAALDAGASIERTYVPRAVLRELDGPAVLVVPLGWDPGEWITRTERRRIYRIDVGIAVKLAAETEKAAADAATGLMDRILAEIEADTIAGVSLDGVEIPTLYDPDAIADGWTFLTKLTASYTEATP